jgi:hypothetical protein
VPDVGLGNRRVAVDDELAEVFFVEKKIIPDP